MDIEKKWLNIQNCYVIDIESFKLNSQIRCIQIYNTHSKFVYLLVNGELANFNQLLLKLHLQQYGIKIKFFFGNEKYIVELLLKLLSIFPKNLIGQNFSHFDLGLIKNKIRKYKLLEEYKVYFKAYQTGKSSAENHLFYTYHLQNQFVKHHNRFVIIDTMHIAKTLTIPYSLAKLSQRANSQFPKKDIHHSIFERTKLPLRSVLYAIYDILSIPDVYRYLRNIIESITKKYLKIESKASQLTCEHIWMKGAGAISECFLSKFLGHIDIGVPDFSTKFFGGMCRVYDFDVITAQGTKENTIRELDFTSAYPFSIVKQGIFDILNGNFNFYHNEKVTSEEYEKLVYSSIIELKCKKSIKLLYECDIHKGNGMISFGYLRSFDNDMRVSNLEHCFGWLQCERGEKIFLTKTELEMNKLLNPNLFEFIAIRKVKFGLSAKSLEKSLEYIDLFKERLKLKKEKNEGEYAVKQILASSYGKLASGDSDFYHIACASAITAFQRFQLFALTIKSSRLGLQNLYSDTDSLKTKGTLTLIQRLQDYGNLLNEWPKKLFDMDNLKMEDKNIICFNAIKRKRYTEIYYDKENKMSIKVKGENGNSDFGWRDILFRLSLITNGSLNIIEIKEKIQRKEFTYGLPTKPNLLLLNEEKQRLQKEIQELKQTIKDLELMDEEGLSKYSDDSIEEIKEDLIVEDNDNILKIGEMYETNTRQIYQEIEMKKERIQEINDIIKYQYLSLFRTTYQNYKERELNEIIPELQSNAKITMMYNTHFKLSVNYNEGVYYDKIRSAWEQETSEKAYIGCFFSINRKLLESRIGTEVFWLGSFKPKNAEEFSFEFNPQSYVSEYDIMPTILNQTINEILLKPLCLDTIVLKTGDVLPLWILPEETMREFTRNSYRFGHSKVVTHRYLDSKSIMLRLRLKEVNHFNFHLENPQIIKYGLKEKYDFSRDKSTWEKNLPYLDILKEPIREKNEEGKIEKYIEEYANTNLFYTNIKHYKALMRFNKFRLFCKNPNFFNVYYYINKLARITQYTMQRMFLTYGMDLNLPRFRMVNQIDISQATTQEFHKQLYDSVYDCQWNKVILNNYIQVDFLSYASLSCYNKEVSAKRVIALKKLTDNEKEYFENEAKEKWRAEIKFTLQRNQYETISYLYLLNLIDMKYFIQFIANSKQVHSEKNPNFKFSAFLSGYFQISKEKCLFLIRPWTWGKINIDNQEMPVDLLEGRRGFIPPPLISQNVRLEKVEEKIGRIRQKNNEIDEKVVNWKFGEKIEGLSQEELMKKENRLESEIIKVVR